MAISPGGEEAGGLQEKQTSFLVQVCLRAAAQPQEFRFKVHLDCIHQNISVLTNDLVSVNAKKPSNNKNVVSGAALNSSAQLQTIKKTEK